VPVVWTETTAERFEEMLTVLPPAIMLAGNFLVGEPWDHHAVTGRPRFAAYRFQDRKYYEASRPMTVKEFKACLREQFGNLDPV